jgi:hypothetical protein
MLRPCRAYCKEPRAKYYGALGKYFKAANTGQTPDDETVITLVPDWPGTFPDCFSLGELATSKKVLDALG